MAIITQRQPQTRSETVAALNSLAVAAAARLSALRHSFAAKEIALVIGGYLTYFLVRGLTEGSHVTAVENSHSIVELEKSTGFFWEPAIQERIVDHHWIVTLANWMYIWGHWPLIALVAGWLLFNKRETFTIFRSAFFVSGAIGVAIFVLFPVAPPRLAEIGLVDTVTQHSNAYRFLQPKAFTNQYAAVPSLHFGWDLLIGIALVTNARSLAVRAFGAVVPLLMLAAIVLTANHYIFDAIAGGAVALTGLGTAMAMHGYGAALRERLSFGLKSPYERAAPAS